MSRNKQEAAAKIGKGKGRGRSTAAWHENRNKLRPGISRPRPDARPKAMRPPSHQRRTHAGILQWAGSDWAQWDEYLCLPPS